MRYFYMLAVLFVAGVVQAQNYIDSEAAISYNPSRLGAYSHLKVVKQAQLTGLDATNADVNIMSTGTVTLQSACSGTSCPASQTITHILPMPAVASCSGSDFCAADDDANYQTKLNTTTDAVVGSTVDTATLGDIASNDNNVAFPSAASLTVVTVKGGSFTDNGNAFVNTLTADVTKLTLQLNKLIMNNGTTINATSSVSLGGKSVGTPGSRNLYWDERTDTSGKKAKVLVAH